MQYGIKLNRKHPSAPETCKGCVWVDEHEEVYVKRNMAKRFGTKSEAKRAITEPCENVEELPPNVKLRGAL